MTLALFDTRDPRKKISAGEIARIDLSDSSLRKPGLDPANNISQAVSPQFPELSQLAYFEIAFHHDLPRVVRNIPVGGYIDRLPQTGKKGGNPQ